MPSGCRVKQSGLIGQDHCGLPSYRQQALLGWVQEEVAAVLGLAGVEAVPADRPLSELGLDSRTRVRAT